MSDSFITPDVMKQTIKDAVDPVNKFLWAITGVLLVGFIAMLITVAAMVIDVFQSRTEATNQLRDEIRILNEKLHPIEQETIISMPK